MLPAFYILRALQKGTAKGPERVGLSCSASLGKDTTGAGFAPQPPKRNQHPAHKMPRPERHRDGVQMFNN